VWKTAGYFKILKQIPTDEEIQNFQTGYKQEKFYRENVKKLLQFEKDRVTL